MMIMMVTGATMLHDTTIPPSPAASCELLLIMKKKFIKYQSIYFPQPNVNVNICIIPEADGCRRTQTQAHTHTHTHTHTSSLHGKRLFYFTRYGKHRCGSGAS